MKVHRYADRLQGRGGKRLEALLGMLLSSYYALTSTKVFTLFLYKSDNEVFSIVSHRKIKMKNENNSVKK